jgi:hypothetical protein
VSATEIIAEIKKLPVSEQEEVLVFLALQRNERTGGEAAVRYARDEDVDKAIENVMRDRADLFRRLAR